MDFLKLLRDEIRGGLRRTPDAYRSKHAAWLQRELTDGGGFANRRGVGELYYTTFGLRGLSCLEALTPEIAAKALVFLRAETAKARHPFRDAVSAVSWWDAVALCAEAGGGELSKDECTEAQRRTAEGLAALRRDDGGWAKTSIEGNGSLYHSFLACCAFARAGMPQPEAKGIAAFLDSVKHGGGGFRENAYSKRPGTNGTAAGVALSLILKARAMPGLLAKIASWPALAKAALPLAAKDLVAHGTFLASMRGEEGGLHATASAPIADLLSTFTGCFTLRTLGALDETLLARVQSYARSLECEDGGYLGFALERDPDCEYTFYGLGVMSLG